MRRFSPFVFALFFTAAVLAGCAADQISSAEESGDYSVYSGTWSSQWQGVTTDAGMFDVRYNLDLDVTSDGRLEAEFWVETRDNTDPKRQSWSGVIDGSIIKLLLDDFVLECCPDLRSGSYEGRINERFIRLNGSEFSNRLDGDLYLFSDR